MGREGGVEEEVVEVEQGRRRRHCLLETAGPMGEVEGAGLGERQKSARRMEEEVAEAGGGGGDGGEEEEADELPWWEEVEEAGHPEFLVWREVEVVELRLGLWREEGEEELLGPLWTEVEEGVEPSCGEAEEEEEEGHHHEKEVEGELQVETTHTIRIHQ